MSGSLEQAANSREAMQGGESTEAGRALKGSYEMDKKMVIIAAMWSAQGRGTIGLPLLAHSTAHGPPPPKSSITVCTY